MLSEYFLKTPGGELNIATGAENGPLLVLLHGFTNRWQTFLPIIPTLVEKWRVVAFDHRGHGRSARIDGPYNAAAFYADAEAVLQHLGAPALLLGHSMGGSLALHLAEAFPERVRAVVTGDTSLSLSIHTQVMNHRRRTKLFGLRRKLASRPVDELVRRGLDTEQAIELSQLDPHVMDFHAEGRVEEFFEGISEICLDDIRCPLMLTQANPEKGGILQDEEITLRFSPKPGARQLTNFDCGHDMEINLGAQSPFFNAAIQFFNELESQ